MREKKMKELDICIALAKLERLEGLRIEDTPSGDVLTFWDVYSGYNEYNPLTQLNLTMKAIMDYRVEIEYSGNTKRGDGQIWIANKHSVYFSCKSEVPHAICECILKSKGLWK